MTFVDFFSFFCLLMITAVQSKALSDEDIRTNQQFAKVFKDTIKVCWFDCLELFLRAYEFFSSKAYIIDFFFFSEIKHILEFAPRNFSFYVLLKQRKVCKTSSDFDPRSCCERHGSILHLM